MCLMLYIVSLQQVDHVVINTLSLESLNQMLMYHLNYNTIKLSFKVFALCCTGTSRLEN